jgi:hypothetical protein
VGGGVTDLEKIQRLTFVNAALALGAMHCGAQAAVKLLKRAGLSNPETYVYDAAPAEHAIACIIAECVAAGLLPEPPTGAGNPEP